MKWTIYTTCLNGSHSIYFEVASNGLRNLYWHSLMWNKRCILRMCADRIWRTQSFPYDMITDIFILVNWDKYLFGFYLLSFMCIYIQNINSINS